MKEDVADAWAEFNGIDDAFGVQYLQRGRAGAGYLRCYFDECKGEFATASTVKVCRL